MNNSLVESLRSAVEHSVVIKIEMHIAENLGMYFEFIPGNIVNGEEAIIVYGQNGEEFEFPATGVEYAQDYECYEISVNGTYITITF